MKYDFELDIKGENSLSLIINNLNKDTVILEFGPANGRLTRYLKEKMNCDVYLVEMDEQAGKEALMFGKDLVIGDIESYEWFERYKAIKFDHIIFADVLEHLNNPLKALKLSKQCLKDTGTILISVPNLAHNAVAIDLLNNKFSYTTVGLLDDTHIHFFTKNSLDKMVNDAGLFVSKEMGTTADVGTIEIKNTINDVKGISPFFWNTRQYGNVYQYVYELVTKEIKKVSYIQKQQKKYFFQLYYNKNSEWSEDKTEKQYINADNDIQRIEVRMPEPVNIVRVDPLNANCIIQILHVTGNGEEKDISYEVKKTNASCFFENIYYFDNDDPQIIYCFSKTIDSFVIEYRIIEEDISHGACNADIYLHMLEMLRNLTAQCDTLEKQKEAINNKYRNEKLRADILQQQRKELEDKRLYKIYKFLTGNRCKNE